MKRSVTDKRRKALFLILFSITFIVNIFANGLTVHASEGGGLSRILLTASGNRKSSRDIREEEELLKKQGETQVEEYNLKIIEDQEVPKAALPERSKRRMAPTLWVVIGLLLLVIAVLYIRDMIRFKKRIKHLEKNLTREEIKRLTGSTVMFSPGKRAKAVDEIENKLVSEYIDN